MSELNLLIDELATGVMAADPDDLQGLTRLHDSFDSAAKALLGTATPAAADCATSAAKLIERVILGEIRDVRGAIGQITSAVSELQSIVNAALGGNAPPMPAAAPEPAATEETADPYGGDEPTFGDADLDALAREFVAEATSHVEAAEAALLALEETPDDPEPVKTPFRAVHTIKGTAGFVNLKQIPRLAHATETLLDLARRGKLTVAGTTADVVLDAIDRLKLLVGQVAAAVDSHGTIPQNAGLDQLIKRINAIADGKELPAGAAPAAAVATIAVAPAAPAIVPVAPAAVSPAVATPAAPHAAEAPQPAATVAAPTPAAPASNAPPSNGAPSNAESSVKVSTERLDALINSVGELVITQAMLEQTASSRRDNGEALSRGMAHLGKLTRELQDLAMSMRMVPVGGVFQKMARLIRDLSRKAGKQIEFESTGAETELDRNLVEAIADPLVHMIRNAADHGIETPDVRLKAGKSPIGHINLRAYHQGGSVVIEIADDGKGLVKQRILNKAIERGIVRPDQQLDENEIFALIFHAGLSTAEKVTDVSGRGVGMDVVKRNIEQLRGRIEIRSVEGQGTTFTIRLPLTLAVMDGLIVRVGSERYIVPILGVEQSERLTPDRVTTIHGRGELATVRGKLLPVVRLHQLFDVETTKTELAGGLVVIVQDEVRRCALLVDELIGRQQVVIKSLGEDVGRPRGVAGGAILGDGRVNLILDIPGLLEMSAH